MKNIASLLNGRLAQVTTVFFLLHFVIALNSYSQNIGINKPNPSATLDVNGSLKTNTLAINLGGNTSDFLVKSNVAGDIGYQKGHQAQAIRYMICVQGVFPYLGMPYVPTEPYIGTIIMHALTNPNIVPEGFVLCEGQILLIASNTALFSLIQNAYGGDGISTFALPDMRGTSPLGAGNGWAVGQRN